MLSKEVVLGINLCKGCELNKALVGVGSLSLGLGIDLRNRYKLNEALVGVSSLSS